MTVKNCYDVIIIGAGIVGTSVARELSKFNTRILILEKESDVSMGATKANSAIVHGGYAEDCSQLKGRLAYKGRLQFKRLNEELNFGFRESGSLVVTTDNNKEPLEKLRQNGLKNGLKDLAIIGPDEIRRREPNLSTEIKWALYCKGAGVCSPYEMAIAMAENAMKNGAELKLENEVESIEKIDSTFRVSTDKGEFYSSYIVNAAGVYADKISRMIGVDDFKILPRSGEYLLFNRGTGEAIHSVVFQTPTKMGKGVLLTSTYYGNLLIGPDSDDDSDKEDTSTHLERMGDIYSKAKSLYQDINPKQFIKSFTGIRARSSTEDFIIEETSIKGFINVAGIQSPGLTASPAIAEMVREILREAGLALEPNRSFDPYRKPIITKKALKPFIDIKDKIDLPLGAEGRIVCRCEQVTEEEIVEALHRGIRLKTIDAIKRRTRATMGGCQGEFCTSRVLEVVKREYGEDMEGSPDIERRGVNRVKKSELLFFLKQVEEAEAHMEKILDIGPFYQGTKADLNPGDLLEPGFNSNYGEQNKANFIYLTGTLDAAIWGAELALGDGPGRIYLVEPTGAFENDPNLTDKKFPGNPTRSYRTKSPLRVVGEVLDWEGHSPEVLQNMLDHLEKLKQLGVEAIND